MSREKDANRLADDLESLRTGRLSEREFRAKCEAALHPFTLTDVIWPNLEHYLADLDIRERDPDYRAMQEGEMDKLVQLLRTGAPDVELARISFLGYSRVRISVQTAARDS
jgi:hypothetical protein